MHLYLEGSASEDSEAHPECRRQSPHQHKEGGSWTEDTES